MRVQQGLRAAASMYWRMLSEANRLKRRDGSGQTDEQIDELETLVIHSEYPFLAARARTAIAFLQPHEHAAVSEAKG